MSQDPLDPGEQNWEALLRSMLGEQGAQEAIAAMRAAGIDPSAMAQAAGLPSGGAELSVMLSQIQHLMATGEDGPLNWSLARDVSAQLVNQGGDPTVTAAHAAEVTTALQTAELWLDTATDLPPSAGQRHAWSRADWVSHTLPTWQRLVEPVAASMVAAMQQVIADQAEMLEGHPLAAQLGNPATLLNKLGGAVMGMQIGHAVGTLAGEVFGTSDTGLPLADSGTMALVPHNVLAFSEGLDVPEAEVRLFLATREAAHARLFSHASWLGPQLLAAVESYAGEIAIDTDAMEQAVRDLDISDPEALREAMAGGMFAVGQTESQRAALQRLETMLALVEGWVEEVTAGAVAAHLPHAIPLREMMRRRRAAGGPAESTFASLVGLELRPRRLREAATLWGEVARHGGTAARDDLWAHPDLLPNAADLDAPLEFVAARESAAAHEEDVDAALAQLLGSADEASGAGAAEKDEATGDGPSDEGPAEGGEPAGDDR
ncbi:MAG TPA: zinc-dependent metalloprotease [Actinomycetaceae bacterium]|nr:zinc-dependent metalloprotease [Actinomycetaceae bacterium]